MYFFEKNKRFFLFYKVLCAFFAVVFLTITIIPQGYAQINSSQTILNLPILGTMVSATDAFVPSMIKGITIHPDNPLRFDFIIDQGENDLNKGELQTQATQLVKYFLASLTVPEDELWVNLSPYEKNRIIPQGFGQTEMGRDLLAQDYMLKQLTASLMYPEEDLGGEFWSRIYERTYEEYGITDVPVNTFHKVWIVPEKALVYEHENTAFVVESQLKVMLEEDYEAMNHNVGEGLAPARNEGGGKPLPYNNSNNISTSIIREILIPEIQHEVNTGKIFANLRQIYSAMILSTWYKQKFAVGNGHARSLLGHVYVDQNKTKGVDVDDKQIAQKIYDQYLESFKKGVYDYIKEDYDPGIDQIIPRKYFSGGYWHDPDVLATTQKLALGDQAMLEKRNDKTFKFIIDFKEVESGGHLSFSQRTRWDASMVITPREQSDFLIDGFKNFKTAVYPSYFENFGPLEADVIKEGLKVFDKIVLLDRTEGFSFLNDFMQEKIEDIYTKAKQMFSEEEMENIVVMGISEEEAVKSFLKQANISGMVRKFHQVETKGKLDREAKKSKKNYEEFGLQTIFTIPSYEFLKIPDEGQRQPALDYYFTSFTKLLSEKSIKGVPFTIRDVIRHFEDIFRWKYHHFATGKEVSSTRRQLEARVKKFSLLEQLGKKAQAGNPKIAFYAGSFDPLTNGHLEVIQQAARIYDEVYVAIGENPDKESRFTKKQQKEMVEEALRIRGLENVKVIAYEGLTVEAAAEVNAGTLIRGARDVADLKEEIYRAWANQILNPHMRTVLMTPHHHKGVSSSDVKKKFDAGDDISNLVPGSVFEEMMKGRLKPMIGDTQLGEGEHSDDAMLGGLRKFIKSTIVGGSGFFVGSSVDEILSRWIFDGPWPYIVGGVALMAGFLADKYISGDVFSMRELTGKSKNQVFNKTAYFETTITGNDRHTSFGTGDSFIEGVLLHEGDILKSDLFKIKGSEKDAEFKRQYKIAKIVAKNVKGYVAYNIVKHHGEEFIHQIGITPEAFEVRAQGENPFRGKYKNNFKEFAAKVKEEYSKVEKQSQDKFLNKKVVLVNKAIEIIDSSGGRGMGNQINIDSARKLVPVLEKLAAKAGYREFSRAYAVLAYGVAKMDGVRLGGPWSNDINERYKFFENLIDLLEKRRDSVIDSIYSLTGRSSGKKTKFDDSKDAVVVEDEEENIQIVTTTEIDLLKAELKVITFDRVLFEVEENRTRLGNLSNMSGREKGVVLYKNNPSLKGGMYMKGWHGYLYGDDLKSIIYGEEDYLEVMFQKIEKIVKKVQSPLVINFVKKDIKIEGGLLEEDYDVEIDALGIELPKNVSEEDFLKQIKAEMEDVAMIQNMESTSTGGINLDPAMLNLQIRRDGKGVPLPMVEQDVDLGMRVIGFYPVVINVMPVNVPQLLGFAGDDLHDTVSQDQEWPDDLSWEFMSLPTLLFQRRVSFVDKGRGRCYI